MSKAERLEHLKFSVNFADFDCSLTKYNLSNGIEYLVAVRLNQIPNHANGKGKLRKANTITHITKHEDINDARKAYNDALNLMKKHTYLKQTIIELQCINNQRVSMKEVTLS